jgi:hypothetical protein
MAKGTDSEHVLEIVQVDKANGQIYMSRIGAGHSRSFSFPQK